MYEKVGEELVDEGLPKYREEVTWMDINVNVCAEKDPYGWKCRCVTTIV